MRLLLHRATQCRAQFGQGVFDGGRYGRVYLAFHQAVALELLQGLRQHLLRDAGDIPSTLPPGRAQGVEGPLKASRAFRAAVLQMIVAGDRVTAALRFTGHFTGTLGEHQGQGQAIDFIAMDIYRIADGRIAEDWHLEDNLAFMRQAGLVGR